MSNITYRRGLNSVRFLYSVWRGGVPVANLSPYGAGTMTHSADGELQDSIQATFIDYSGEGVDFVTDILRVECEINGEIYPLGRYCITTEKPGMQGGVAVVDVEGYSVLWILKQCKLEAIRTWAKGTQYVAVINGLIAEAGFSSYDITPTDAVLATDRADWDIGTDFLTIINDLLAEINYNQLFADFEGTIRGTPYVAPTIASVTHIYNEGENSLISADYDTEADRYDVANVFIVVCENPELSTTMRAESVNADPKSPYSTVSLGRRVPRIERVDNTPSQAELQATADRLRAESMQTEERIEVTTAIMPDHGANETLLVQVGDIAGVYRETGFEIELSETGQMKHKAARVIT